MEISTNGYNNPVNFYPKNTGNNINMAIEGENRLYGSNIFAPEFMAKETKTKATIPIKRKRRSKRLNTIDTEYLPDETEEVQPQKKDGNFFIESKRKRFKEKIIKILNKTPLINYFFLRNKTNKIQKTVATLNDINQNMDELLNTAIPYGETNEIYSNIAKNLTDAANILGKAKKDFN